jgi:hypothetical protein
MKCDEAAEFVSALCDGEMIPRAAAEHIGTCPMCRSLMREYMEMGAELRRVASLETGESAMPRVWSRPESLSAKWWKKGWGTMRIPRVAFATLIAAVAVLGSSLALVKVRAHSEGTVLVLKVMRPDAEPVACPLSTQDKNQAVCAFFGATNGKNIGYKIDLLGHEGSRVQLGVRTKTFGTPSGSFNLADIQSEPQKEVDFEPGETLKLDMPGTGALTVTGEWFDHMPAFIGTGTNREIDPQANELRMVMPLLLRDGMLVGDLEGASATAPDLAAVIVYIRGEGLFILSLTPVKGAVKADVNLSRITFNEDAHAYTFLTGVPVTRSNHLWVLHNAGFTPPQGMDSKFWITTADVNKLPSEWTFSAR